MMTYKHAAITSSLCLLGLLSGCSNGVDSTKPRDLGTPALVVSEFLYSHPGDSLEWIELRNDGTAATRLGGVSIKAVDYTFPGGLPDLQPGQRVIITSSPSLFAKYYPGVAILDSFPGRLDDQGEEIELNNAKGVNFKTTYGNQAPWPAAAAALGSSLVWTGADPANPNSWSASITPGGDPGSGERPIAQSAIRIAEIRPFDTKDSGFLELASSASTPTNLEGWVLRDLQDSTAVVGLPAGTVIPAGGRLVLAQSNPIWGKLELANWGGHLLLIPAKNTGAATSFRWNAIPAGASAGIPLGAQAHDRGATLSRPTPGTADSSIFSPTIAISEICPEPSPGQAEFVELVNLTDSVIRLADASKSGFAWKVDGIDFTFGALDTIPAKGRFLLVSRQDRRADAWRAEAKIPTTVPVANYTGRLSNEGEYVSIEAPIVPITDLLGNLVWSTQTIDGATWSPRTPWPATISGQGHCLHRVRFDLPGTSPSAWKSATPTPGL